MGRCPHPDQLVVAAATQHHVEAAVAAQEIVAFSSVHGVDAVAAVNDVGSFLSEELVVTPLAV
jgi:hypothetical protein